MEPRVAVLTMTEDEVALRQLVGTQVFLQGRAHVSRGEVVSSLDLETGRVVGQVGARSPQSVVVSLDRDDDGEIETIGTFCTCGGPQACQHAVALLLATLVETVESVPGSDLAVRSGAPGRRGPAPWERSLAGLMGGDSLTAPQSEPARIGLQFELVTDQVQRRDARRSSARIALRPVVPGAKGNWVRTGISWSKLSYGFGGYDGYGSYDSPEIQPDHLNLLTEILALANNGDDEYLDYRDKNLYLDTISSRRIWDLLAEAREVGLPLLQSGKRESAVELHRVPARTSMQVGRSGKGLELYPQVEVGDTAVVLGASASLRTGSPGGSRPASPNHRRRTACCDWHRWRGGSIRS
jgi:hypothetical protein